MRASCNTASVEPTDELVRRLRALVGDAHVLTDADQRAGYETDWTGRYVGTCAAVVRPGDTGEVTRVLAFCNDHDVAVVTQAGNTGLVGGGVPHGSPDRATIVVSTRRLDTFGEIDASSMQVTTGAGVTIADWQRAARAGGLDTPVDFAARESATVGGAIATNAGGSRVVRYGTMRRQVVGVEAVLADGSIVGSLSGLPKETLGLHWPSLLAGSEGTLAVITAARLQLVPHFEQVTTMLAALDDLDAALAVLAAVRHRVGSLDSIEVMFPEAIAAAATASGTPTYKLDVAMPGSSIGRLLEVARSAAARQGARLVPFGHLAEGNVHLNFLDTTRPDDIAESVLPAVARVGGTISAEHGVGVAKTRWLHRVRSPGDLSAQRSIKRALDPNGILNPGVLDPSAARR
jgi:FAD/FMN-containing dehydrogenase